MTMEMAKKALAEQRGLAGNPGGGISEISDKDAKEYMQANPIYGDEFNQDRGATIGVQDLYKLFNYRGEHDDYGDGQKSFSRAKRFGW